MAIKRGKGISAVWYSTGMSGGGDPSQVMVKMRHDGSVDVLIGSVDIGQGARTNHRRAGRRRDPRVVQTFGGRVHSNQWVSDFKRPNPLSWARVPRVTNLWTNTVFSWPMRKARSLAWSSTAGFHQRSK